MAGLTTEHTKTFVPTALAFLRRQLTILVQLGRSSVLVVVAVAVALVARVRLRVQSRVPITGARALLRVIPRGLVAVATSRRVIRTVPGVFTPGSGVRRLGGLGKHGLFSTFFLDALPVPLVEQLNHRSHFLGSPGFSFPGDQVLETRGETVVHLRAECTVIPAGLSG